jgi:hypothetical protein
MQPTDPGPVTVDAFGVAIMLGLPTAQAFLTRRARLQRRGFPKPLPIRPLVWVRAAVEDWAREAHRLQKAAHARAAAAHARELRHPVIRALAGRAA